MEQVTVRMDEWFFTQGLVGYKKILESYGEKVQTTHDGIVVDKRHLKILADAFFTYYLNHYNVASQEEQVLRRLHSQFKNGDTSVKKDLNGHIKDIKKEVGKYFSDIPEGKKLIEVADFYRKEKRYIAEMDQWINEFIENLNTTQINQMLTINSFKYNSKQDSLKPYFGQVSFLNVTHNKKSLNEQKAIFYNDFIAPVFEEWKLWSALSDGNEEEIFEVLNTTSYKELNSLKRTLKKKSLEEMMDYINREVHQCSFTDFPIALHYFEEGVFLPLALSLKNTNITWNVQGKLLPLCSLARLLIFCAQAGATRSQGKSIFVYYGGTFDEIYQTNQFYTDMKNPNKTFDEIVFDLVREQKVKANFLQKHYLIFEYVSDIDTKKKKTLLDYTVMTPPIMKLFSMHGNLFNSIHYTIKGAFIRSLLQGRDPKHLITNVLRNKIKNNYSTFEVIRMTQIRHLNQFYTKGEDANMDSSLQKRYVWALVKSAEEVKHHVGQKKAQGIAYRLLNAVRSNDKHTFMDTVMRMYISCKLQMPGLLLEVLHEDKMDFETVGNAWIAGLVSNSNDIKEGEKADEQE